MSLPIRFLPEAKDEYDQAADWYEQQKPGLGVDFIARVSDVLTRISQLPQMHAVVYKDVRKGGVRRFPYIVLYREDQNEIIIVSVFHTARDPSTWQSRV